VGKPLRKQQNKLRARQAAHDSLSESDKLGRKRPGSMNRNKRLSGAIKKKRR